MAERYVKEKPKKDDDSYFLIRDKYRCNNLIGELVHTNENEWVFCPNEVIGSMSLSLIVFIKNQLEELNNG